MVQSTTRNSSPNIPSITSNEALINLLPLGNVNLSSSVSTFCEEDAKSKFPADFFSIEWPFYVLCKHCAMIKFCIVGKSPIKLPYIQGNKEVSKTEYPKVPFSSKKNLFYFEKNQI